MKKIFFAVLSFVLVFGQVFGARAMPLSDVQFDFVTCADPPASAPEGVTADCVDMGSYIEITFSIDISSSWYHPHAYLLWLVDDLLVTAGIPLTLDLDSQVCLGSSTQSYARSAWLYSNYFTTETTLGEEMDMGSGSAATCYPMMLTGYEFIATSATPGLEFAFNNEWSSDSTMSGTLKIYNPLCAYYILTDDSYEIDPTIEAPLGPDGDPADDQIYPTVTGSTYAVYLEGGPWNDGTTDQGQDVDVSWDGETWVPLSSYPASSCIAFDSEGNQVDVRFLNADSDTLYIRVSDTEGEFDDNYNNPDPVIYHVAKALPIGDTCEGQFSYDTGSDLVASVSVPGNLDDVFTTGDLDPNEWYAITVTSGTWEDDGVPPDRTDMEFKVDGSKSYNEDADYKDLGSGEGGVWCQSSDATTWFIQAQNTDLSLRVNNESGDFTTNSGTLSVSIYHAAFERNLEACEFDFSTFEDPMYGTVDAGQSNGKEFAYATDNIGQTPLDGSIGHRIGNYDSNLVPGAFYIMDTVDGPWSTVIGTSSNQLGVARYDVAVNTGAAWMPLEDWTLPECNVPLDALGHRRVYFQVPLSGAEWRIRVNDDDTWDRNSGYMAWNLYKAISDSVSGTIGHHNPWLPCTDGYQLDGVFEALWIPVQQEDGTYLQPGGLGWGTTESLPLPHPIFQDNNAVLSVGDVFAVTVAQGPWDDGAGNLSYDAQISSDNGVTWYDFDDNSNPDVVCSQPDQAHRYWTVMFEVQEDQLWKIRVADTADNFSDNTGSLGYRIYKVGPALTEIGTTGSKPGDHPGDVRTGVCDLGTLLPQMSIDMPDSPNLPTPTGITDFQGIAEFFVALVSEPLSYSANLGWALIQATGNYIGDWIDYASFAIRSYFAWCPRNTEMIRALIDHFTTREPVATLTELNQAVGNIVQELSGYDWDVEVVDTTIFTVTGRAELNQMIQDRFFPTDSAARNPWNGGDVISFDNTSLPTYFYTCSTLFTDYLPEGLKTGVCFVNAYARETGLSFFMQLVLDAGALFGIYAMFKGTAQELIYMMTGVKPWVKSRGVRGNADRLLDYMERRDREADAGRSNRSGRYRR